MNRERIVYHVVEVAKRVGAFIRDERKSFSYEKVEFKKSKSNLVSYVDRGAEQRILEGIQSLIPEAGYITEEEQTNQEKKEYTWIIDPLDGTTNFVHGIPNYCVSIGLMYEKEIILGVVYEVVNSECFYAWKGGGAYLNHQPIRVSKATEVSEVVLATGFPYHNFEKLEEYFKILNQLMKNTQGLRRMGSAAADMAYVACGRYGGFFEYNLNSYDIAAGIVLVQEAGGTVTDFKGGTDYLFGKELVAGGNIQPELLKTIKQHW